MSLVVLTGGHAASEELLVEAERLAAELDGVDPPTLLDVRWRLIGPPGRDDYLAGHLPGAVFVDLDTALCGAPGPAGRTRCPNRSRWRRRCGRRRAGRRYRATVRPGALPVLDATAAARLAAGDGVLIDVRAAPRYRGEHEPIDPVAGHIPGAVNLPAPEYVTEGRFPAAETLRHRFAAVGVAAEAPVGAYCGSGVTGAQAVLALHLVGRTDAALYVGSWSNWVADPDRPVATDT